MTNKIKEEFEWIFLVDGEKHWKLNGFISDDFAFDTEVLWNWIEEKLHETKRESIRHGIKMGKNMAKYHDVTPT